ncbi:hypothetical protein [Paeniglutamicibacter sp. NPDC091659]|uniref:hypothetical protein n=1 Tax=Paeniglutamicibacter sp. NPDC091659 TaxID=3364389 RepID=UPI003800C5BB
MTNLLLGSQSRNNRELDPEPIQLHSAGIPVSAFRPNHKIRPKKSFWASFRRMGAEQVLLFG